MQRVLRTEAGRGANGTNPKLPPLKKKQVVVSSLLIPKKGMFFANRMNQVKSFPRFLLIQWMVFYVAYCSEKRPQD